MNDGHEIIEQLAGTGFGRRAVRAARVAAMTVAVSGAFGLGGCIQVAAPDKPIVIELNINIRQEVVYRLAADAAKTVDENKGIF
ncbi:MULTISPECIES: YnbE family lipoprotein [unclassified Novosphingobium]|uniref:YnbE family lipoprotein n=1 Tax=unclassified Novosphingobium TaxID=2644732 RepID=UPI001F222C64|nr:MULTISPECIES: YnbE family lipoprotein [unclassified Novosphingobium]